MRLFCTLCLCGVNALPVYNVPSFSLVELELATQTADVAHKSVDFTAAINNVGIMAITDIPSLGVLREVAFSEFRRCLAVHDPDTSYAIASDGGVFHQATLADGTIRRSVVSSQLKGVPQSLPKDVRSLCPLLDAAMTPFRATVAKVHDSFLRRLDVELSPGESDRSTGALLQARGNSSFQSLRHIATEAVNLEHFHRYSGALGRDNETRALELHKDLGLFITFVPALLLEDRNKPDEGFLIEINGKIQQARFPGDENVLVFMFGQGAEDWIEFPAGLHPRAVPHALQMGTSARAREREWYGLMTLVPRHAYLDQGKTVTFEQLQYVMGTLPQRSHDSRSLAVGCDHGRLLGASVDPASCKGDTLYCWMTCLALPACSSTQHAVCLQPSLSTLEQQTEACHGAQGPGSAMNPQCVPLCIANPAQLTSGGDQTQPRAPQSNDDYCSFGTTMYMSGFVWPGDEEAQICIVYLFKGWILNTKAKFVVACIGTIFFAASLEGLMYWRRQVTEKYQSKLGHKNFVVFSGLLYGTQLTVGYLVMLVIMMYSGPLFICVIAGLILGHMAFNVKLKSPPPAAMSANKGDATQDEVQPLRSGVARPSRAQEQLQEDDQSNGATPCCAH